MDVSKIIRGIVNSRGYTITSAITQWDYGYVFVPEFEDLPATYRLDFSNDEHHGTALPVYCGSEGGEVPEELIDTGKDIFVWFFYIGDGFGKTEYKWRIPNKCKPKTEQDEPTPTQQSSIDQLITRSNEAVEQAEQSASDASTSAQNASADAERAEEARTDAQNYATQAEQARDDAQTYANNASASATASANSASQSAQIKADVEDLVDDAQGYAQASERSASASANSASQAQGYAQSATASANSASGYASSAQTSAQTATAKASEASGYAQTASAKATESAQSATSAQGYAQTAEQAKEDASTFAQRSANSAQASADSATASAQSASQSAQIKADVEDLVDDAQTSANLSGISARASGEFASQAQGFARQAESYALGASGYASNAQTSANTASNKASEASTSASTASAKATESAQSASQALSYKNDAESAKTASQTAQGLAESARESAIQAKMDAESARDEAQSIVDGISGKTEQIDSNTERIESLEDDRYKPYAVDTASGAVASFTDGADDLPLKSLIVNIDPVQDTSSGDPSPENICPISGWTACKVWRAGINIWDEQTKVGTFDNSTGVHNPNRTDIICTNTPIKVTPSTSYYLAFPSGVTAGNVYFYDSNMSFLSMTYNNANKVVTTPSGCGYVNISFGAVYGSTYNHDISINYPSTDHSYHPYTGQSIAINLGQTVYGGKLDVLSGKLTIYPYYDSYNGETLTGEWISDRDKYVSGTTPTIGAQVVNIGAQGVTVQLEPHEVESLYGVNNLWADSGDSEVVYRADTKLYINKKIAEAISALS